MAVGYQSLPNHYYQSPDLPSFGSPHEAYDAGSVAASGPYQYHKPLDTFEISSQPRSSAFRPSKHRVDWATTLVLFSVWAFLCLSCLVLLGMVDLVTSTISDDDVWMDGDTIVGTIAISSAPILTATIINEVLVDRCWRRVIYSALGRKARAQPSRKLARNLRAANFEWLRFIGRLFRGRTSKRDFRSMASYGLLRWGTAISIASVQLCASWTRSHPESDVYSVDKRHLWLLGPIVLHACSIFGTMLIWMKPPWKFFSNCYNDYGLLQKYSPYLERVRGGSIAKYNVVAYHLEVDHIDPPPLTARNSPGIQFGAKFSGIWFGLLTMCIPPVLAGFYFRYTSHHDVLATGVYRFLFHFVFLAQNILYLLALDFAVWNVSMEGFCKRDGARPNDSLRHLGYSSGIILFFKAVRQRRPKRAIIFIWLFWIQASLMRCVTVLYTLCISALSYGTYDDRATFYDPNFWLGWIILTSVFVLPLFAVWLVTKSEVPICQQDGWRWAKIAQYAQYETGYYGVREGRAVWGADVQPFTEHVGNVLT